MMSRLLAVISIILLITSCEESSKEQEWGISLLYMPQAVIQSGGSNNNYYVELDSSNIADTSIVVGLYRSGLAPLESVTVDLSLDADTLAKAIAGGLISNAKLLDPAYYELPSSLILTSGQRNSVDYIVIHKDLLWSDTEPDDMKFILPVRISNPTLYELNNDLSLCMFIFTRNK